MRLVSAALFAAVFVLPTTARADDDASQPVGSVAVDRSYFYIAAGLTAAAGVFTIASGIDTANKHSDFDGSGCGTGAGPVPLDCSTKSKDGQNAQTRTNILLGTTFVLAAATAAMGIFAVRWHDGTSARFGPGYASLTFR